jgi:hypothetical protein
VIDPRALDTLVGIVAETPEDGQVVVDVGSNGFKTLRPARWRTGSSLCSRSWATAW